MILCGVTRVVAYCRYDDGTASEGQAVSLRSCTAIALEEPMTKDQAIEVLLAHAKRCPEPQPRLYGYPEDIREDYQEWRERQAKVNEAVSVLTSGAS